MHQSRAQRFLGKVETIASGQDIRQKPGLLAEEKIAKITQIRLYIKVGAGLLAQAAAC